MKHTVRDARIDLLEDLLHLIEHVETTEVFGYILQGMLMLEKCNLTEDGEKKK